MVAISNRSPVYTRAEIETFSGKRPVSDYCDELPRIVAELKPATELSALSLRDTGSVPNPGWELFSVPEPGHRSEHGECPAPVTEVHHRCWRAEKRCQTAVRLHRCQLQVLSLIHI